jgi:hypothetical protein
MATPLHLDPVSFRMMGPNRYPGGGKGGYERERKSGPGAGGGGGARPGNQVDRPRPAAPMQPAPQVRKSPIDDLTEQLNKLALTVNQLQQKGSGGQASFVQLVDEQVEQVEEFETPLQERVFRVYVGEKRGGADPMGVDEAPVKRMTRRPRVQYRVPLEDEPEQAAPPAPPRAAAPRAAPGARGRAAAGRANDPAVRSGELEYQVAYDLLRKLKHSIALELYAKLDHKKVVRYMSEFLATGSIQLPQQAAAGGGQPGQAVAVNTVQTEEAYQAGGHGSGGAVAYRSGGRNTRKWTVLRCDEVYVCGEKISAVVDTGASVTIFTEALLTKFGLIKMVKATPATTIDVADGSNVEVIGTLPNVPITIAGCTLKVDALVTKALSYDALIGCDWLCPMGITLDLGSREMVVAGNRVVALECGNGFIEASYVGHFVEQRQMGVGGNAEAGSEPANQPLCRTS